MDTSEVQRFDVFIRDEEQLIKFTDNFDNC